MGGDLDRRSRSPPKPSQSHKPDLRSSESSKASSKGMAGSKPGKVVADDEPSLNTPLDGVAARLVIVVYHFILSK